MAEFYVKYPVVGFVLSREALAWAREMLIEYLVGKLR
jgi:hypothetical protein